MKIRATENLALKITAVFLFFFAIIVLELSILGIVSCEALGIYDIQWLGEDLPDAATLHTLLITWKNRLPYTAFLSATLTAVTLVYLCCAAGHRAEKPGITFNLQDRIPYDLYLCLIFGAIWLIGMTAILELPALAALQSTQSVVNKFPTGFRLNIAKDVKVPHILKIKRLLTFPLSVQSELN